MKGVTCLLDIVNPWFPHVDGILVLSFFSYCLSWKIGNMPTVESDGVCPMSLPGFRGGRRAAQQLPSEHSLHQGQPRPEALFLDVQKPFFLVKASQSFLLCSFFHGLMVEDSLFPPRPAPSPAPAPGDPTGLAMMGGCVHSLGCLRRGVRASGSFQKRTWKLGSFGMWHHPRGYVLNFLVRLASS